MSYGLLGQLPNFKSLPDFVHGWVDDEFKQERCEDTADHWAAIRRITSEPAPCAHMIGTSHRNITATVITLGRRRFTAPSSICGAEIVHVSHECGSLSLFV